LAETVTSSDKLSREGAAEESTDMFRRVELPTDAGVPICGDAAGELTLRSTMLALPFSSVDILKDRDRIKDLAWCRIGVTPGLVASSEETLSSSCKRCCDEARRLATYPVECVGVMLEDHVIDIKEGSVAEDGREVEDDHVADRVRDGGALEVKFSLEVGWLAAHSSREPWPST
jgi:hypothetical protein